VVIYAWRLFLRLRGTVGIQKNRESKDPGLVKIFDDSVDEGYRVYGVIDTSYSSYLFI
jgi:hypothetical protein